MSSPPLKTKISEDLEYSLGVINYLSSCYNGRYAFFKVLSDLGVAGVDPNELGRSADILKRIEPWFDELTKGIPLFAANWTAPGTFEAKKALDFLEAIKPELRWISTVALKALTQGNPKNLPLDELRILAACIARMKISNRAYSLGQVRFGEALQLAEFSAYYKALLPQLEEDLHATWIMTEALKDPTAVLGDSFIAGLAAEVETISPLALSQVHDINILTARFRGGISFATIEFTPQEAPAWVSAGLSPSDAGFWRAYGIAAPEASLWLKSGIEHPSVMVVWRGLGFSISDASTWLQLQFSNPHEAAAWRDAGFPPIEARSFRDRGITDPAAVPRLSK